MGAYINGLSHLRSLKKAVSILMLFLLFICTSSSANEVLWMKSDFPPWHILEGTYKGEGISDGIESILKKNLKDYKHIQLDSSFKRIIYYMQSGKNCCYSAMLKKPERLAFACFSLPIVLSPPNALIVLKKNAHKIDKTKGSVTFAKLIQNQSLTFGHSNYRSYSSQIDNILKNNEPKANILTLTRTDQSKKMFELLLNERIDYTIAYPFEAAYEFSRLNAKDSAISIPIQEDPQFKLVYIACTKNDWGKTLINRINTILIKERPTAAYRAQIERWLDPNMLKRYRKLYQEKIIGNAPSVKSNY